MALCHGVFIAHKKIHLFHNLKKKLYTRILTSNEIGIIIANSQQPTTRKFLEESHVKTLHYSSYSNFY